jgi:protocatechuate 3,4-dioxygenase beta subunit
MNRRAALRGLGSIAVLPLLPACDGPLIAPDASGADAGLTDAAMADAAAADAGALRWASGGTASMTGVASYPNPFVAVPDPSCALTLPTTLGPCFYTSPERIDVSEGYPGLPMRLTFRVLDRTCAPMLGARLDIWHTGNTGLYSGGPIDFCTGGDADAIARNYFRGTQVSDAEGIVRFDTCFPGAYDGRALHIHLQVFPAGSASASIISQVFFPQPLIDEIFALHPEYTPTGTPDTPNASDSIYRSVGTAAIVAFERMDDGAMLAWKDIIVGG